MSEKVLAHPDQLPPREIQQQLQNLHTLYGARVLPDTVFTCLNGAPGSLDNFGSSLGDKDSVVARVTRELGRLCMRSHDKLVTTRFWTFADRDKRAQHSTVNSVANASRNSILRFWLLRSMQPAGPAATPPLRPLHRLKRKRTAKFSNLVSMALGERPELTPALCHDGVRLAQRVHCCPSRTLAVSRKS